MLILLNIPLSYFSAINGADQFNDATKFIKLQSLTQAEGIGITEANDLQFGAMVWEHVKDFYSLASENSELHLFLPVGDDFNTVFTYDETTISANLEQYLSGNDEIKVIGVTPAREEGFLPDPNPDLLVITPEFDVSDTPFLDALGTLQAWVVRQRSRNARYQAFMGLYDFADRAGTDPSFVAQAPDLRTAAANRVSVLVSTDKDRYDELVANGLDSKHSQLGLLLAKVATIPVQRNIGRVRDGALPVATGVLSGFDENVVSYPQSTQDSLTDRGYIFYVKYPGRAGFFYNDDPTATADDDDFRTVANGRVIDKMARIAYDTLLEYVKDEVLIDPGTGKIAPAYAKAVEGEVEGAINVLMTNEGELSGGVDCTIDPDQNILATETLSVELQAVPVGYSKTINVTIAFNNPLSA